MPQFKRVELRSYRHHRLEVLDDGGEGWAIAIHAARQARPVMLRNRVPNGLGQLLAEAQATVDRWIDGRPQQDRA